MPFTVRPDGLVVGEKSPLCEHRAEEVKARVALEAARTAIDELSQALEEFWTKEEEK